MADEMDKKLLLPIKREKGRTRPQSTHAASVRPAVAHDFDGEVLMISFSPEHFRKLEVLSKKDFDDSSSLTNFRADRRFQPILRGFDSVFASSDCKETSLSQWSSLVRSASSSLTNKPSQMLFGGGES